MALSNKWKICLSVGAIVTLYTILIFTSGIFNSFYLKHQYDLVQPTEAYNECLAHPPVAEKRIRECDENGLLALQWIWWLALKSTIASLWICDSLFCVEYYPLLRQIAIRIFGFVVFAGVVFGLWVAYKRKTAKRSKRFDPDDERYVNPVVPYNQSHPIIFVVGDPEQAVNGIKPRLQYK